MGSQAQGESTPWRPALARDRQRNTAPAIGQPACRRPTAALQDNGPRSWRSQARALPGQGRLPHRAGGGHAFPLILVDANLLLYAYYPRAEQHEKSRVWLEAVLSGPDLVRFAWLTLWALLRIATNPRVFDRPLSICGRPLQARENFRIVVARSRMQSDAAICPAFDAAKIAAGLYGCSRTERNQVLEAQGRHLAPA
jgi:predicted nucleic acid-binding protein